MPLNLRTTSQHEESFRVKTICMLQGGGHRESAKCSISHFLVVKVTALIRNLSLNEKLLHIQRRIYVLFVDRPAAFSIVFWLPFSSRSRGVNLKGQGCKDLAKCPSCAVSVSSSKVVECSWACTW